MANFIVPPIQDIDFGYNKGSHRNDIINLDLCKRIRITVQPYGSEFRPALIFVGCDYSWVFNTEQERDDTLAQILKENSNHGREKNSLDV